MKKIYGKKKQRRHLIYICFAAAVACVCIALLIAPLFRKNNEITTENNPGAVAEATTYIPIPTTEKVVLTGSNISTERVMIMIEKIPGPGKIYITPGLSDALEDPDNAGALFYAAVSIYYTLGEDFKYESKTLEEWFDEPILKKYKEVYQTWHDEVYIPYDAEMTAAEERGEEYAQGWWKHDQLELFNNYWNETQPEDIKAAYAAARANAAEAEIAYNNWIVSEEFRQLENEIFESERSRLAGLGYELTVSGRKLTGNLTKQQIEDFPALTEYGYTIGFAEGEVLAG